MTSFLPIVFLAALLLSAWLTYSKPDTSIPWPRWVGALILVFGLILASRHFASQTQAGTIMVGGVVGAAAACIGAGLGLIRAEGPAQLALAGVSGGVVSLLCHKDLSNAVLAETCFASLVAISLGARGAWVSSVAIGALSFVQILAIYAGSAFTYESCGPLLILSICLLGIVGQLGKRFFKMSEKYWIPASAVLGMGLVYLCLLKRMPEENGWKTMILAPVAALVAHFSLQDDEIGTFSAIMVSVIWIGMATAAFGIALGFGITLAFLISAAILIAWSSDKALLSAGPLMALALHRVFRELHPGIASSIDIGEHYALVGFCVGLLIPLLPGEWLDRIRRDLGEASKKITDLKLLLRISSGVLLWQILLVAGPALLALFLAPKGLLGFVTGLGFCGLISLFNAKSSVISLVAAAALGAASVLEYGWVEDLDDLTRSDKIHWLEYGATGLAVVGLLLYFLGRIGKPAAKTLETA